jgi:hypothetical protein
MRGRRAEAGEMGAGEEDKEERERKAHKRVDDATRERPIFESGCRQSRSWRRRN